MLFCIQHRGTICDMGTLPLKEKCAMFMELEVVELGEDIKGAINNVFVFLRVWSKPLTTHHWLHEVLLKVIRGYYLGIIM